MIIWMAKVESIISKKYSIEAPSQVKRWLNAYQEFCDERPVRKRQNQKYSVQFKLDASIP